MTKREIDAVPAKTHLRRRLLGGILLMVLYAFFLLIPLAPIPWVELGPRSQEALWWFSASLAVLALGASLLTRAGRLAVADRNPGSLGKQLLVVLLTPVLVLGWSWLAGHQAISAVNLLLARAQVERGVIAQITWTGRKCSSGIGVHWMAETQMARHCMSESAASELKVGQTVTRRKYAGPFGEASSLWVEPESGYGPAAYRAELKRRYFAMFWIGLGPMLTIALGLAVAGDRWGWAAAAFAPFIAFGLL